MADLAFVVEAWTIRKAAKKNMTKKQQLRFLMLSLAAGDSLGSTSEFCDQSDIPTLYERHKVQGWPFQQVGGGTFNWKRGEPTDDSAMAMCTVRSFIARESFNPADIASRFVGWLESSPPDVGTATRRGLTQIRSGVPWHKGGFSEYKRNRNSAANGSLMRNAPVVAMAQTLPQAFEFSLKQSIITHYGPLPVACCCAQSFLIWQLLAGEHPFESRWHDDFFKQFLRWLSSSTDPVIQAWRHETAGDQADAWETLRRADFDANSFSPFGYEFNGSDGYCLLTLQIAVWAAQWSLTGESFPTPSRYPSEPFAKAVGPLFGAAVALIGRDSDTYGAVAFPLIAAAVGRLPSESVNALMVVKELDELGLAATV